MNSPYLDVEENPEELVGGEGNEGVEESDALYFLRQSPQFAQICQLVRSQPDTLQQVLGQIATANPDLMRVIRENREGFLAMINDPNAIVGEQGAESAAGADVGHPAQDAGAGFQTIRITEDDRAALDRVSCFYLCRSICPLVL